MKIFLFDDHPIVRFSVESIVHQFFSKSELFFPANGQELFSMAVNISPDLIILDVNIPNEDTFFLTEKILNHRPEQKILIFSSNSEELFALRYYKLGVFGYLHKSASSSEIGNAIRTIIEGRKYFSVATSMLISEQLLNPKNDNLFERLSPREFAILKLLFEGKSNVEIATALFLQPTTIGTHKHRIFEKLGTKSLIDVYEIFRQYNR